MRWISRHFRLVIRAAEFIGDRQKSSSSVWFAYKFRLLAIMASTDPAETRLKFDEFCSILNLDAITREQAWRSFERISVNYTLEVCNQLCKASFTALHELFMKYNFNFHVDVRLLF